MTGYRQRRLSTGPDKRPNGKRGASQTGKVTLPAPASAYILGLSSLPGIQAL